MVTGQLWLDRASSLQVSGLSTNVAFLRALCQHPAFQAAELDTSFIAKHMDTLMAPAQPDASVLAMAAVAWHLIAVKVATAASLVAGPVARLTSRGSSQDIRKGQQIFCKYCAVVLLSAGLKAASRGMIPEC